ncbi:hypothetical protein Zm00014a_028256 [Zea mays]|uniref:Uncharacterized protein n=1 Tax=Zea mays TaxID=4577 RepID=A0A317Y784_MAIZE|nr:hypothetical protein Zm00014a_028256 [Zea mays]
MASRVEHVKGIIVKDKVVLSVKSLMIILAKIPDGKRAGSARIVIPLSTRTLHALGTAGTTGQMVALQLQA